MQILDATTKARLKVEEAIARKAIKPSPAKHSDLLSAEQIRQARRLLGWNSIKLARKSNLKFSAVVKLQAPDSASDPEAMRGVRRAFEAAGIVFDPAGMPVRRQEKP